MGNVVQCCQALSNFFRCKDTPVQGDAERSPLLSSEESECESPSLPDDLEDELLTADGVTNPALQPEHFLFPDIILSSNPAGEVTLVEPMVCLLVSEEEEEVVKADEPGGEQERSHRWRSFTEVETQTEAETQIGLGVQTQTESEILVCNTVNVQQEHEEVRQVEAQTAPERPSEITVKMSESLEAENWTDMEVLAEKMKGQEEKIIPEKLSTSSTAHTVKAEYNPELNVSEVFRLFQTQERVREPHTDCTPYNSHHLTLSQADVQPATFTSTETVDVFDTSGRRDQDEEAGQTAVEPHHDADCTQAEADPEPSDPTEGLDATPTGEDERDAAVPHVEDDQAATKQTLVLVDGLFLAPHVRAAPGQTEEVPVDDGLQQSDADRWRLSVSDMLDLQESDFTVRIQPPGSDSFELEVSGQMLVVELHQVLMEHELTCHRTCFSLQLGGAALDSLAELRSIQGIQDGALIKVVEDSYTVRDARLHLRHVRDLLRSLDPADAYNGLNCRSLSYLTFFTRGDDDGGGAGSRRAPVRESAGCSPPEFILPGCKDRPLTALQPLRDDWKPLQCLRVLTMSSWNPPPGNRKMHGDLMYLNVLTMENRELNITSSTRGFYLNQSTAFNFNPKPAVPKILCHSLVELLSQVSPAFRKTFSALQRKRVQQHPYERIAAPFQVFTWTARLGDHALDCVRAEETHTSRMGQDETTAGQSRDWNEELQRSRELSRNSLQERLHRERSLFKTNRDFVAAAARGAVAVIDGNVMPLNPGEEPHSQMFIWNNLFFSLGFDISEHYRPLGGDAAAHAAATCDLRGAQAYSSVDVQGLHTLGTAVVDYRGIRVIAQTIVPGILEKNQEQSVVYGSNDYGKTVFTHPRFLELLDKTIKPLRIQRHQVLDHSDRPVELCSGIETKGILGNDGRAYILDLLRTFPPDLNFQFPEPEERSEAPAEPQSAGYPRRHRHSLASLRPELVEAFIQHRYELFEQMVSQELIQPEEAGETEPVPADTDSGVQRNAVVMEACEAVGSASSCGFDVRFNPDVCSPGVRFPSESGEQLQRQRRLLRDAAAFLLSNQIPAALRDCLDHPAVPMDGASLTSVLHQRGVNVRYLGAVLSELQRLQDGDRLTHVQRISISEVVIRSAKHIFRTYLQDVEPAAFSAAVSHFLNCLLSSSSCFPDSCSDELLSRRRSKRRRSHGGRVATVTGSAWARLTPSELWGQIRAEAAGYYHHTFHSESLDELIEKHNLQRISLLREIAMKTGIQVQLREYVFESRHRPAFTEEDVVNMFPVVKHLKPTATDATRLIQHAQEAVQQGLLRDGFELISQALTLFSAVCGVLHEDVCTCLRLLGRLCYILGEYSDALSHQEKAVLSSERTQGIDHPQTVQDYTHLALYCFAAGRPLTSLQLLYRARYLSLLLSGEEQPQVALLDSMLGLVLHGLMENDLALKFLQSAVALTCRFHGAASLRHAQCHHQLAAVYESKGEFRSALQHEKEAYLIYKSQVGENHDRTAESSASLQRLTQQAVNLQKALNQIYSRSTRSCVAPAQFSTPSFPSILQQLNLTCGIIVLSLSDTEVSDLRSALKQKEKLQVEELEKSLNTNLN